MTDPTQDSAPLSSDEGEGLSGLFLRWKFHIWSTGVLLGSVCVFAVWSYQVWNFSPSQTLISLRYADHVRHGAGWVLNSNEHPPVEGYVNPLWIFLNAFSFPESISPLVAAKGASTAITLLTAFFVFFWTYNSLKKREHAGLSFFAGGISSSLFLFSPSLPLAAVSGSEYPLAILCFALFLFYSEWFVSKPKRRHAVALALLSICTILLRPELSVPVMMAITISYLVITERRMLLHYTILPVLATLAIWFAWRALSTNSFLPLAATHLAVDWGTLEAGYGRVWSASLGMAASWLFAIVAVVRLLRQQRSYVPVIAGLFSFLVLAGFVVGSVRSNIPLLLPIYPLLSALTAIGFVGVVRALMDHYLIPVVITAFVGVLFWQGRDFSQQRQTVLESEYDNAHVYAPLGHALSEVRSHSERTIAIDEIASVGYYSRWTLLALNRNFNSMVGGTNEQPVYDADSVLVRRPSIVALVSSEQKTFAAVRRADSLLYDRSDDFGYRNVAAIRMNGGRSLWILTSHADLILPLYRTLSEHLPLTMELSSPSRRGRTSPRNPAKSLR